MPAKTACVLLAALAASLGPSNAQELSPEEQGAALLLLQGIQAQDTRQVATLLAQGAPTDVTDHLGRTPLFYAALNGNPNMVSMLLEAGADPGIASLRDNAPIHAIILSTQYNDDTVRALVAHGVDIDTPGYQGFAPLHFAVSRGDINIITALVEEFGADVNTLSEFALTPMEIAIGEGFDPIAQYLSENGGKLGAPDQNGKSALHRLAEGRVTDAGWQIVLDFIGEGNIDLTDDFGATALHIAAFDGNVDAIERLLAAGADPNHANIRDVVPVHWPAITDKPDAIRVLAEAGADLDAKDESGTTALFHAVQFGSIAALRALLSSGADPAVRSRKGMMPIHIAAEEGEAASIPLLARFGSPLESLDENGNTPLQLAAASGRDEAIAALVESGADPNFQNGTGRTALHSASLANRGDPAEVLIGLGADTGITDEKGQGPLGAAWENGHISGFFTILLEKFIPG